MKKTAYILISLLYLLCISGCVNSIGNKADTTVFSADTPAGTADVSVTEKTFVSECESTVTDATMTDPEESSVDETSAEETETEEGSPVNPADIIADGDFATNITAAEKLELINRIRDISDEYPKAAVAYIGTGSGEYFLISGERQYNFQSTVKAAYAEYLLEEEKIDLDEKIKLSEIKYESSSEIFVKKNVGKEYTVSEIMSAMLISSDNQAYWMLHSIYGNERFLAYAEREMSARFIIEGNEMYGKCTVTDLARVMLYLYNKYEEIPFAVDCLLKTSRNDIAAGTDWKVARKYGYASKQSDRHSAAIVFAEPDPYVLVIFTKCSAFSPKIFSRITKLTDEMQLVGKAIAAGEN